jgi:hypothetical protein
MVIESLYYGPVTKLHEVRVDLAGIHPGKSILTFFIDGAFAGRVEEWEGVWYDRITNGGPNGNSIKIAENREDAFRWWMRRNGYTAAWVNEGEVTQDASN